MMTSPDSKGRLLAILALLLTMFFWGSAAVFIRSLALAISPENSLALRYAILAAINLAGLLIFGCWRAARQDWPRFLVVGIVGMGGYNWFVNQGFALVPAGIGTVITSVEPLMLAILAIVLLKERLTPFVLLGLLVALLGIVVLFWNDLVTGVSTISLKGAAALWACAFCWAFYTVLALPLVKTYGSFAVTALTMIIAAPVLIWPATEPLLGLAMKLDARQWAELLYLVIPNGILGTMLWNFGAQRLPQAATGAFLYLIPVVAILCGRTILGEAITANAVLGAALSIAGVALAQFGPAFLPKRA
jgi:drug/metabolite transporter (DMT)-like permease